MMIGMGIPRSQSKIGITLPPFLSLPGARNEITVIPRAVPILAAFSGGKAGRECAEERRRRHPKRKLRCIASRPIRIGFCLLYDVVHPLFRIGLTQADIGGD